MLSFFHTRFLEEPETIKKGLSKQAYMAIDCIPFNTGDSLGKTFERDVIPIEVSKHGVIHIREIVFHTATNQTT